jgi:surface antigen
MIQSVRRKAIHLTVAAAMLVSMGGASGGCATKTQTGLLVGGAGGAAVGGAIGSASGNAGKGALIGGAIGLLGGGLIGASADAQDRKAEERRRYEDDRRSRQYEPRPSNQRLTKEQVATWARQGTRDDIIIDRIERSDSVFRLSAADEQNLQQQGVSEDVILAMKETARR